MNSNRPYIARALYEWILDNDCTPYILVDAERRGVEVPRNFVKDGQIVLNISPTAIRALHMDNDVITFDGRFAEEALTILIPFDALMAIYARENGQGMVFETEPEADIDESTRKSTTKRSLEAVSDTDKSGTEPSQKPRKPGKPSLTVVK